MTHPTSTPPLSELGRIKNRYAAETGPEMALTEAQLYVLRNAIGQVSLTTDQVPRQLVQMSGGTIPRDEVAISVQPPFATHEQAQDAVTTFTQDWEMVTRYLSPDEQDRTPQFVPHPDLAAPEA